MKCEHCAGKGYVETYFAGAASFTPSLEQCPKCCNTAAYSNEVQKRLNNPVHVTERKVLAPARGIAPVIQLRKTNGPGNN